MRILFVTLLFFFLTVFASGQLYAPFRFQIDGQSFRLAEAMRNVHASNVSAALSAPALDSSFTYAVEGPAPAKTTYYPAGAAGTMPIRLAVLQLAERGRIDLDQPVNRYLCSVPLAGRFGATLTVRDLLLGRYQLGKRSKPRGLAPGQDLPTTTNLVKKLRADKVRPPDGNTTYGNDLVLQLLLEDSYGEALPAILKREVFSPLGMRNSFYALQLTPSQLVNAAVGHEEDGRPILENRRYAELSAMGLWTTPSDFARFGRAILEARKGANPILGRELALAGTTAQYGFNSLLFHVDEQGMVYSGGNFFGYFFIMNMDVAANWVSVAAVNTQLKWQIGGAVSRQLGLLARQAASEDHLTIFLPQGSDSPVADEVEHFAMVSAIRCSRSAKFPAEITGTPAFVLQSPRGRSIYSGRHDDAEAIRGWLRSNQLMLRSMVPDIRTGLYQERGRQRISLPIKYTAAFPLIARFEAALGSELGLTEGTCDLGPLDRRVYLDLHPYAEPTGNYAVTYALFSQFNCHEAVSTNYGDPVAVGADGQGLQELIQKIAVAFRALNRPEAGFTPAAIAADIPSAPWASIGYVAPAAALAAQARDTFQPPLALGARYVVNQDEADPPGLFFGFPAPLDRYAGEVRRLSGQFFLADNGRQISGRFELPVAAIRTSSTALDDYVLGTLLRAGRYPTAALTIPPCRVPAPWRLGVEQGIDLPATLEILGQKITVTLRSTFTPAPNGELRAAATFWLDFPEVFGVAGPDGPAEARRRLEFSAALTAQRAA
ncbi:serine hydrolase domain-containing protein [Neolewinella lacunae]|uniref:Serine hydrolase n=1 Tax=Neolewinella lacunae TaxID=1517758 RepID=A0A923PEN8_9BACT|nr:serine hydrolase domain-containing protein [Neolewinella lacunae]MBC6992723.1 serine hydrolase [Neolewinella lacunae]MDN3635967.1 serine hydrolase domain-containing protein [Neolewinella lacunae]